MADEVAAVKENAQKVYDDLDLGSKNSIDRVEAINGWLCGKSFEYDPELGKNDENPYDWSVYGVFVNQTKDGVHRIVCEGYAVAVQTLCMMGPQDKQVPCLMVFGLGVDSDSADLHAWNVVSIDGNIWAVDATYNDTGGDDRAYLLAGANTQTGGVTFMQSHQPFTFYGSSSEIEQMLGFSGQLDLGYEFVSPELTADGYEWPAEENLVEQISGYAPWIVVTLICILLAYVLWSIGKKGE